MTQRLLTRWFLTSTERGNPSSRLYARHPGGAAWTEGNMVRPLIHGSTYFAELHRRVSQMRDGDLLMFVDWRGDPDERLTGSPDTEVGKVFADAARRGVDVRGLVWRSHWDRLAFSAAENRRLGDEINDAGGQCLLDMRVRTGGSHHQKFVVLRHGPRPAAMARRPAPTRQPLGLAAAPAEPGPRTRRSPYRAAAPHVSSPRRWLPLRPTGRTQRGARLHQSRGPGTPPDLHRGPVPLVARRRSDIHRGVDE